MSSPNKHNEHPELQSHFDGIKEQCEHLKRSARLAATSEAECWDAYQVVAADNNFLRSRLLDPGAEGQGMVPYWKGAYQRLGRDIEFLRNRLANRPCAQSTVRNGVSVEIHERVVEDNIFLHKTLQKEEQDSSNPVNVRMEGDRTVGADLEAANNTIEELHFLIAAQKAEATVADIEITRLKTQVGALKIQVRNKLNSLNLVKKLLMESRQCAISPPILNRAHHHLIPLVSNGPISPLATSHHYAPGFNPASQN